jgi:hypothetical protein
MKIKPLPLHPSRETTASGPDGIAAAGLPPAHVNPFEWEQAMGLARQICARIFRDGGTPEQALQACSLAPRAGANWSRAVDLIAEAMTTPAASRRRAA